MIINEEGTYNLVYTATDECGNETVVNRELVVEVPLPDIVTWAGGTDEQIVAMVQAADKGIINLADYWHVGDERVVHLSAMDAMSPLTDTHAAQDARLVLMNVGGKTLNTPTESGRTECSFIVGMENLLNELGSMSDQASTVGGWESCPRRTWCNSTFYNAIPSTLRPIFKQHLNKASNGGDPTSGAIESVDYFALPAEYEVCGLYSFSSSTYETGLTQFEWYETSSHRKKYYGNTVATWWLRSPREDSSLLYCSINTSGSPGANNAASVRYLSPFGCI